jgi:hypothetical protein
MSYIDIDDILFVYSGGPVNNNPDNSLGGTASLAEIPAGINNLFDNISEEESEDGRIDYRCFYLKNSSANNTLYDTTAYLTDLSGGSTLALGIQTVATDIQHVTISATATGGSLTLNYEGDDFTFNWNANKTIWAQNFQTAINALDDISDVTVSYATVGTSDRFVVQFGGIYDHRKHDSLTLTANNLIGGVSVTLAKHTNGSPIQTTAPLLAIDTATPANVQFSSPTATSPLSVGTIKPGDVVPFWLRRTIAADTDPIRNDGVGFRIVGKPF